MREKFFIKEDGRLVFVEMLRIVYRYRLKLFYDVRIFVIRVVDISFESLEESLSDESR